MTSIRAAGLSTSVFVEEAGNIGSHDRADAEMAERGQDGAVEVAHAGLHRGRLPRGRAPLDIFAGELRQRRAGSGKGHGTPAALLAREEGERDGARLVGLHRARLAERGAPSRRNWNTQDRAPFGWTRSMKPCRAVSWRKCDFLRPSAFSSHTP